MDMLRPVHVVPLELVAMAFPPEPTATHKPAPEPSLPYAIPFIEVVMLEEVAVVQIIPSSELAKLPLPLGLPEPAIHITPFQAMLYPAKGVLNG
jgi:hypothetical protein